MVFQRAEEDMSSRCFHAALNKQPCIATTRLAIPDESSITHGTSVRTVSKKLQKKALGLNYYPGEHAVPCGRGKVYSSSPGNRYLKALVNHYLVPYSMTTTKAEKSQIVTAIINAVHATPDGMFIRFQKGQWWEVDDAFAREKIGSLFRDILFTKYRSSTKAKMAKKKGVGHIEEVQIVSMNYSLPSKKLDVVEGAGEAIDFEKTPHFRLERCKSYGNVSQVSLDEARVDLPSSESPLRGDEMFISFPYYTNNVWPSERPSDPASSFRIPSSPPERTILKVPRQVSASPSVHDVPSLSIPQITEPSPLAHEFEEPEIPDDMSSEIDALDSFLQDCF